jgi:hypothetical protein
MTTIQSDRPSDERLSGAILLGTGLAVASLILVPAFATRLGWGMALTGAVRIALMRASHRAVNKGAGDGETDTACMSCH